jgi:hypothetical protein
MTPASIARSTRALGAPPNWDHSKASCGVLPIRDEVDQETNGKTMVSAWLPSKAELKAMQNGCPVILTLFTTVHPATSIGVGSKADLG